MVQAPTIDVHQASTADGLHDAGRDLIVNRLEGQDDRSEYDRTQRAREQQDRILAQQPLNEDESEHKKLWLASQPERRYEPAARQHALTVGRGNVLCVAMRRPQELTR
jgi:hypothetical protein